LSEEQPEESEQPQDERPWSAPPPRIELPDTDFGPLRPLEPALGEAIAQSFNVPQMPEFETPIIEGEPMRNPMNRPADTRVGEVCPHGLAGLCVWCPRYPCEYMLKRALRFLITMVEYGGERTPI